MNPCKQAHVLLVEDQPVNQMLIKAILAKAKCRVDVANNGQEALDKIKENTYDLVFMDCQMPVMDGFEATRRIRNDEEGTGRHLPIVALTADSMMGDRARCIAHGMDEHASKPIRVETVYEMLRKYTAATV